MGWLLNVSIGAQVILGALTTGISAATSGRATSVVTSVLGGFSTIAASYLAKARHSNEPVRSASFAEDLTNFKRKLDAFITDHGNDLATEMQDKVDTLRGELEDVMKRNYDHEVTLKTGAGVNEMGGMWVAGGGHVHGVVGGQVTPAVGHGVYVPPAAVHGAQIAPHPGTVVYGPSISGGLGSTALSGGPQPNVHAQQGKMADPSAAKSTA